MQFFKLEDAYYTLYATHWEMQDRLANHSFGEKRKFSERCYGCCLSLMLLSVILLPMLLFSTLNPAVEVNNIYRGSVRVDFLIRNVTHD